MITFVVIRDNCFRHIKLSLHVREVINIISELFIKETTH